MSVCLQTLMLLPENGWSRLSFVWALRFRLYDSDLCVIWSACFELSRRRTVKGLGVSLKAIPAKNGCTLGTLLKGICKEAQFLKLSCNKTGLSLFWISWKHHISLLAFFPADFVPSALSGGWHQLKRRCTSWKMPKSSRCTAWTSTMLRWKVTASLNSSS